MLNSSIITKIMIGAFVLSAVVNVFQFATALRSKSLYKLTLTECEKEKAETKADVLQCQAELYSITNESLKAAAESFGAYVEEVQNVNENNAKTKKAANDLSLVAPDWVDLALPSSVCDSLKQMQTTN